MGGEECKFVYIASCFVGAVAMSHHFYFRPLDRLFIGLNLLIYISSLAFSSSCLCRPCCTRKDTFDRTQHGSMDNNKSSLTTNRCTPLFIYLSIHHPLLCPCFPPILYHPLDFVPCRMAHKGEASPWYLPHYQEYYPPRVDKSSPRHYRGPQGLLPGRGQHLPLCAP